MPFVAIFFTFFGITILAFPDFLAYIIGFIFLFIGINSLVISFMLRRPGKQAEKSWSFGGYEIIKRK